MATNKTTVELEVLAKGLDEAIVKAKSLRDIMLEAGKAASSFRVPGAVAAAREGVAASNAGRSTYRAAAAAPAGGSSTSDTNLSRSIGGLTGAEGRDFGKQAQGLGGLVHVYATFAANLFAVSAAFNALSRAADTTNLVKGLDQLGASSGRNLGSLAKGLAAASQGAISFREAATATALASAGGMTNSQILRMGEVARNASQALGVAMPDAINRLSKGIVKIQPELLDELGIMTRVIPAQRAYGNTIGKSVEQLTDFEKRQAFTNAVLQEGEDKFKNIDLAANSFSKVLASSANIAQKALEGLNFVLAPLMNLLASSPTALSLVLASIGGLLLKQAIPALGKYRKELADTAKASKDLALATYKSREQDSAILEGKVGAAAAKTFNELESTKAKILALTDSSKGISSTKTVDYKSIVSKGMEATPEELEQLNARAKRLAKSNITESNLIKAHTAEILALQKERNDAGNAAQASFAAKQLKAEEAKFSVERGRLLTYQSNVRTALKDDIKQRIAIIQAEGGFGAALGLIKEETKKAKAPQTVNLGLTESGEKITALSTKMNGLQAAILRTSLTFGALGRAGATAITAIMEALGPIMWIITAIGAVFTVLATVLSTNSKAAAEFSSALDTADSSFKNLSATYDAIAKKKPLAAIGIDSTQARANALLDLSDSLKKVSKEYDGVRISSSWFDKKWESIKLNVGQLIRMDLGAENEFSRKLGQFVSIALVEMDDGDAKKAAEAKVKEIFNIPQNSALTGSKQLTSAFRSMTAAEQDVVNVNVGLWMEGISRKSNNTAANLTALKESFKDTDKVVQTANASLENQDYFAKISRSMQADASKIALAVLDGPISSIQTLYELLQHQETLSLLGPNFQADLITANEQITKTATALGKLQNKLSQVKSAQALQVSAELDTKAASGGSSGQVVVRNATLPSGVEAPLAMQTVAQQATTPAKLESLVGKSAAELAKLSIDIQNQQKALTDSQSTKITELSTKAIQAFIAQSQKYFDISLQNAQAIANNIKTTSAISMLKAGGASTANAEFRMAEQAIKFQIEEIKAQRESLTAIDTNSNAISNLTLAVDKNNNILDIRAATEAKDNVALAKATTAAIELDKRQTQKDVKEKVAKMTPAEMQAAATGVTGENDAEKSAYIIMALSEKQAKLNRDRAVNIKIEGLSNQIQVKMAERDLTLTQEKLSNTERLNNDQIKLNDNTIEGINLAQQSLGINFDILATTKSQAEISNIELKRRNSISEIDKKIFSLRAGAKVDTAQGPEAQRQIGNLNTEKSIIQRTALVALVSKEIEFSKLMSISLVKEADRVGELRLAYNSISIDTLNLQETLLGQYDAVYAERKKSLDIDNIELNYAKQYRIELADRIAIENSLFALEVLEKETGIKNDKAKIAATTALSKLDAEIAKNGLKYAKDIGIIEAKNVTDKLAGQEVIRKQQQELTTSNFSLEQTKKSSGLDIELAKLEVRKALGTITEENYILEKAGLETSKRNIAYETSYQKLVSDKATIDADYNIQRLKNIEAIKLFEIGTNRVISNDKLDSLAHIQGTQLDYLEQLVLVEIANIRRVDAAKTGTSSTIAALAPVAIARKALPKNSSTADDEANRLNAALKTQNDLKSKINDNETSALTINATASDTVAATTTDAAIKQAKWNSTLETTAGLLGTISKLGTQLSDVFGEFGKTIGDAFNTYAKSLADTQILEHKIVIDREKYAKDPKKLADAEAQYASDTTQARLEGYAAVTHAASAFFTKGSKGARYMANIERGIHLVQMADSAILLATKLGLITAPLAAKIAVAPAEVAVAGAVAGAELALSIPVMIGKMFAQLGIFAPIGIAVALAAIASAGGKSQAPTMAGIGRGGREETQTETNTRLNIRSSGITGAGTDVTLSDSIDKGFELLSGIAKPELAYSSKQVSLLATINDSILKTSANAYKNLQDFKTGVVKEVGGFVGSSGNVFLSTVEKVGALFNFSIGLATDLANSLTATVTDVFKGETTKNGAIVSGDPGTYDRRDYGSRVLTAGETQVLAGIKLQLPSIIQVLANAGPMLGKASDTVSAALAKVNIDLGSVDLMGADFETVIKGILASFGNQAIETIFPELDAFNIKGEDLVLTLMRVTGGIDESSLVLSKLGITAKNYNDIAIKTAKEFGAEIVKESIVAYEGTASNIGKLVNTLTGSAQEIADTYTGLVTLNTTLIALGQGSNSLTASVLLAAGGLEELTNASSKYFDAFYTATEKTAVTLKGVVKDIGKATTSYGATLTPEQLTAISRLSKSELRNLIESFGEINAINAPLIVGLEKVAVTLGDIEDKANKIKSDQLTKIFGLLASEDNTYAAKALTISRQAELDALENTDKPRQLYIYALEDEAALKGKLKTAYDAASTAVKATITSLKSSIQSLKDYRQNLFTGDKANLTPIEKYTADKQTFMQLAQAAAVVLGSDATTEQVAARDKALGSLAGASDAFLASSKVVFASSAAYQEDFSSVAGVLNSTQAILETQQTDAEKNLAILQSSDNYLKIIDTSTQTTASLMQTFIDAQAASTTAAATSAIAKPSDFDAAVSNLPNSIFDLRDNIALLGQSISGPLTTSLTGLTGAMAAGLIENSRQMGIDGHAKGGIAYGQSLVGEQGPELVDFTSPARVYTARDTNLFGDNKAIIKELQELRKELSQLRQDQQEQTGHLITTNYDANIKAAGKVASATEDATEKAVWLQKSVATIK